MHFSRKCRRFTAQTAFPARSLHAGRPDAHITPTAHVLVSWLVPSRVSFVSATAAAAGVPSGAAPLWRRTPVASHAGDAAPLWRRSRRAPLAQTVSPRHTRVRGDGAPNASVREGVGRVLRCACASQRRRRRRSRCCQSHQYQALCRPPLPRPRPPAFVSGRTSARKWSPRGLPRAAAAVSRHAACNQGLCQ